MDLARLVATRSKDRSRQVGAVIVGLGKEIIATGYNGFPRGINDTVEERHQRPAKYRWTEHAERNAIYNAARSGVSTFGAIIYLPWYPCMDCARAIVQSGISEVIAVEPDWNDPTFAADFKDVAVLFEEAMVAVRFVAGAAPVQKSTVLANPEREGPCIKPFISREVIVAHGGAGAYPPSLSSILPGGGPSSLVDDSPGATLSAEARQALKDQDEAVEPNDFTSRR